MVVSASSGVVGAELFPSCEAYAVQGWKEARHLSWPPALREQEPLWAARQYRLGISAVAIPPGQGRSDPTSTALFTMGLDTTLVRTIAERIGNEASTGIKKSR